MWRPLFFFFFTLLCVAHCACPAGLELVANGECRATYFDSYFYTDIDALNGAATRCDKYGAYPVSIHNKEDNKYWASNVTGTNNYGILGLACNTKTMLWEWIDGSPLDYMGDWPTAYDPKSKCTPGCSWFIYNSDGYWGLYCQHSQSYKMNIFCTKNHVQPTGKCENFENDNDDGLCYQVGTAAKSWKEAETSCQSLGAHLASIHNAEANSIVQRTAVVQGALNGVYLGASIPKPGDDLTWIDGSSVDYANYFPGFPRTGYGDCIAMDTTTSSGQWMNVDCNMKLPYACVRAQQEPYEPKCSSDPVKEGVEIKSPGYPYSASMPCDYFLVADAGKKVQVQILLQANTCCDRLVLYDGSLGGAVIANLTGEVQHTYETKTSNIMRVSWQPNSGKNVRGVAMVYRGF